MKNTLKFREKTKVFLIFAVFSIFLSSCSQLEIVQDDRTLGERKADIRNEEKDIEMEKGLLSDFGNMFGNSSTVGFEGSITYQVALDKVSFMPLSSVDSASGIIITDWYNINNDDLRLKINIRILDENISNDSINVVIFKQSFDGQRWVDQGGDLAQAEKIKKKYFRRS